MHALLAAISLLLMLSCAAAGDDLVVASDGDDSGKGTHESPWKTLQRAVDAATPGDTIVLKDGVYAGCRIRRSGEEGRPITLKAENKWGAVIKGLGDKCRRDAVIEIVADDSTSVTGWWTLDGLDVDGTGARDCVLPVWTTHITIRNSKMHDSDWPCIMAGHSDYMVLDDNMAYGSRRSHGIYMANSASHGVLRRNRSYHNGKCGIHMNGDLSCGPDGIMHDWLVEENVIYDNGLVTGGGAINCDGVCESVFRNNLLFGNHRTGMTFYAIDAAVGSSRNLIANNTVVMAGDGSWPILMPKAEKVLSPASNRFVNNILLPGNANVGSILVHAPDVAGFESDYNVTCGRYSVDGGETLVDAPEWRKLGYDRHSLTATLDALFANPSAGDYRPRPGSAAIDAGAALKEVMRDIEGVTRPQGKGYDIGCYESR